MTREEKQKAIDALKISAPVRAMTQEEFSDYIQVINQVMDWLEQEPSYNSVNSSAESKLKNPKEKNFDILHFIADNAGLSTYEAIEKAYIMGASGKEPCEDAISRKAVLELAKEECETAIIPYRKFVKDINALPPVTPQPAIPLDKVKQARGEIQAESYAEHCDDIATVELRDVLEILDKLIESEEV